MASNSIPAHRSGRAGPESSSFISETLSVSQEFKGDVNAIRLWTGAYAAQLTETKKEPTFFSCILGPVDKFKKKNTY